MAADPVDLGTAGASARREHDRRKTRREQATRERHPRLGGLLIALGESPPSERSWAQGAGGEELVAEAIARGCGPDVVVLHDRRIPGSRANIDHIAVAPSGVWVIDAKRYQGRVRVARPLLGAPKLTIDGRDRTKLADALAKQVALIAPVVERVRPETVVDGALCFVGAGLPLFGAPSINGLAVVGRRAIVKRLNADGPIDTVAVARLVEELARAFPPA